jgi:hypothetical protein
LFSRFFVQALPRTAEGTLMPGPGHEIVSASRLRDESIQLQVARDRKRAAGVKVEGRKSNVEIDAAEHGGQMLALARKLRRKSPKGGRRSLRAVATELAKAGFISRSGQPYAPTAIGRMPGEIK